jgi:hypothetical protein
MKYLVYKYGQQNGPFSTEQICDFLSAGIYTKTDLCWYEGEIEWAPLNTVPEFRKIAPPPSPPPAPSSQLPPTRLKGGNELSFWNAYKDPIRIAVILFAALAFTIYCLLSIFPSKGGRLSSTGFGDTGQIQGQTAPTPDKRGELSRELATVLLNQYLSKPHVTRVGFAPGCFEKAMAEGLIQRQNKPTDFAPYMFTDKGLVLARGLVADDHDISSAGNYEFGTAATPFFSLASPISERVSVVSGITTAPMSSNMLIVEYTTEYIFPNGVSLTSYLYSGAKQNTMFQKYDDGWRISDLQ